MSESENQSVDQIADQVQGQVEDQDVLEDGLEDEVGGRLEDARILIVDDDPDIRQSFDMALQAEGALTMCVGDGNAAVEVCKSDPPDVVVLDMMLPGRSGFLALEKIKGRDDSPAVLMVTANDGKRHQAYAESLGVDGYLLKPVPLDKLVDAIADQLDAIEARGESDGG